jgi:hypothetical protein
VLGHGDPIQNGRLVGEHVGINRSAGLFCFQVEITDSSGSKVKVEKVGIGELLLRIGGEKLLADRICLIAKPLLQLSSSFHVVPGVLIIGQKLRWFVTNNGFELVERVADHQRDVFRLVDPTVSNRVSGDVRAILHWCIPCVLSTLRGRDLQRFGLAEGVYGGADTNREK